MLLTLFITFFKIGLFTIGGGYAMIPLIEREVVERKGWISREDFLDLLAIAQSAPGVFAVNISIFIGYRMRKSIGSLAGHCPVCPGSLCCKHIHIHRLQDA